MKRIISVAVFLIAFLGLVNSGSAQCKGFTKKKCLPQLEPYVYNGQLNSAVLNEGDIAELLLTFYGGQDYRIYICSQEVLGNIEFKLLDTDRNTIFDNTEQNSIDHWDFSANSTQQLIVQVKVPENTSMNEIVASGCVSILIGFKE
ncbi:MAG: hypothetical protein C0594_12340 [Marinilabiliales bacterium]|nr:MAG: hypothetical protein C0594_12340 [Marinilabiliales bacterium]